MIIFKKLINMFYFYLFESFKVLCEFKILILCSQFVFIIHIHGMYLTELDKLACEMTITSVFQKTI